jgi:hypothetical protein
MNSTLIITVLVEAAVASIYIQLTLAVESVSDIYLLEDLDSHWTLFKQEHDKKYESSIHELERKMKFHQNLIRIN